MPKRKEAGIYDMSNKGMHKMPGQKMPMKDSAMAEMMGKKKKKKMMPK